MMFKYPNGQSPKNTKAKVNTANRGMTLENDINISNEYYLSNNIANIHKKPTPIQIVKVDYPSRSAAKIVEAYFKVPSTTDYNGVYKGRAIDFEAKECQSKTSFPFSSIHPHQIQHLKSVLYHGAIAFVIIRFVKYNETYVMKAQDMVTLFEDSTRKSIPYTWFKDNAYLVTYKLNNPVDYLVVIDKIIGDNA